jgi:UDP-N-acetylglucosamine--N-acetylmuramyl-(pentapeptide) pyrophosphoryl-undecaprenol N-acetylglucosamine transferase
MKALFAAGGTGGHIIPALTVARELRSRRPDVEIVFVGNANRLEGRLVPQAGFRLVSVAAAGFPRRLTWRWIPTAGALVAGFAQVAGALRREKPRVVFGTGGYVCGPLLATAALCGIPTVIHESNVVAGLTNRWLGKVVSEVFVGFDQATDAFPATKTRVSGNPLRREILAVAETPRDGSTRKPPWTMAIIGGSQGSRRLNQTVVASLPRLAALPVRLIHQTGELDLDSVRDAYKRFFAECPASDDANALASTRDVVVEPFYADMASVYAQADLILCRAGAMTIAEVAACGIPAILVPLPGAKDQPRNACYAEQAGAAIRLADADLSPDALAEVVTELFTHVERLAEMSRRWRAVAKPDATRTLADALERYL